MHKLLYSWVVHFIAGLSFAHGSAHTLNLKGAIQYAIEHSPLIENSFKTKVIRQLDFRNSIAKLLPSLDLNAVHGLQNNIPIANNYSLLTSNASAPWYSSISLGLTETLYDNGVSYTQSRIASLNQELAHIAFEKSRANLTHEIMNEFYNFSLTHILVEVKQSQLQTLSKQFSSLSEHYLQGLKTKLDYLRFKTQVQRAEIDKVNADKNKEASKIKLYQLLGVSLKDTDLPQFEPIVVQRNRRLEELFPKNEPKIETTYDFRLAEIQKKVNEKNVSFAVRKYWPQVFLSSGIIYSNLNYIHSGTAFGANHQLSWNALLTIQYNFWDWGIRKRDVEVAELTRDIQENEITLGLLDTQQRMRGLMIDLSRIKDNYQLTRDLLNNEEENYSNIEFQYREGKVTYLDMITSLNSLLDARVQFYSVYFQALQNLARYELFEGSIYEKNTKD